MKWLFIAITLIICLIITGIAALLIAPTTIPNASLSKRFSIILNPDKEIQNEVQAMLSIEKGTELVRLDVDAHSFAYKGWCEITGNTYDIDYTTGDVKCSMNQDSCLNGQNLVYKTDPTTGEVSMDIIKSDYREWHNGQCIKTYPLTNNMCKSYNLTYFPGNINCDKDGVCTAAQNPSCYLTSDYCSEQGADFDGSGLGDCYISTVQEIAEVIFGKTYTRKIKQNWSNMISSCHDSPMSSDCLSNSAQAIFVSEVIAYDTAKAFIQQRISDIESNCGSIISSSQINNGQYMECLNSLLELEMPGVWIGEQAIKILDGLLCKIPGIPCGLGEEIQQAIFVFADTAINAIIGKSKEVAIAIGHALYQAAYVISEGVNDVGVGIVNLINQAGVDIIYVANAFAYSGITIYNTMNKLVTTGVYQMVNACKIITSTFEQGGEEMGKIITSAIISAVAAGESIGNALQSLGPILARAFGSATDSVIVALKDFGGDIASCGVSIETGLSNAASELISEFGSIISIF